MKSKLHILLGLIFIALLASATPLMAQTGNPIMDAQWTVISNSGHQLVLELGIRTNTTHEHLGSAQFIFLYDKNTVSFAGGGSTGINGTDYNWIDSFDPAVYILDPSIGYATSSSVTQQPSLGLINIELDLSNAPGVAISATADYTPVVDLTFTGPNPTNSTTITWAMTVGDSPTFDLVADDNFGSFDEGSFKGIVSPLPITLLDFTTHLKNSIATISWETASEINNNYFTIERSGNGSDFSMVKQVKGAGNSEIKNKYTDYDEHPLPGLSYYRLRQTDFNGASKVFNMVAINNTEAICETIEITSAPSASGTKAISYLIPDDDALTLIVTDINGKIIHKDQVAAKKGINTYTFSDVTTWKPGIYFIVLDYKGQSASTKMIIP